MFHRKLLNHPCSYGNFDGLNCIKNDSSQIFVEIVYVNSIAK